MSASLNLTRLHHNDQKKSLNNTLSDPLLTKIEISVLSVLFCFTLIGNLLVIAYLILRIKRDNRSWCCKFKINCKKITRMSFYIVSNLIILLEN